MGRGEWKRQTAQNGLSPLVSLAKGLCPSRLRLQQTANLMHVRGPPRGPTAPPPGRYLHLCTDPRALLEFLNKKPHVTHLMRKGEFPVKSPPLQPHTSWQAALHAAPASHDDIEKQMEMKSL